MNVSGYKIKKQIGKGGMSMVYLAVQESLGRPVALKILNPMFSDTPKFSERFLNEGHILASLNHTNIITIYDIGINDQLHFISMELVDGGNLKDKIRQGITPDTALEYTQTIASSLQTAHAAHIVHRDVKPANILFRNDGTLLLTDFGIAKQLASTQDLTLTGNMVGSPHYLSPEQAQNRTIDGRADIYSLGIILYEMLTGDRPYKGGSHFDIALKHITQDIPRMPDELAKYQNLLDTMTARDATSRFPTMGSLLEALKELRETGKWSGSVSQIQDVTTLPVSDSVYLNEDVTTFTSATPAVLTDTGDTIMLPDLETEYKTTITTLDTVSSDLAQLAANYETSRQPVRSKRTGWLAGITLALIVPLAMGITWYAMLDKQQATTPVMQEDTSTVATNNTQKELERKKQQQIQRQIEQLLVKAEIALHKYHLTSPKNNNAYDYYRQIARLDPEHIEVNRGFERIADKYHVLARGAEINWDYDRASDLVARGLRVKPDHSQLLSMQHQLRQNKDDIGTKTRQSLSSIKKLF